MKVPIHARIYSRSTAIFFKINSALHFPEVKHKITDFSFWSSPIL